MKHSTPHPQTPLERQFSRGAVNQLARNGIHTVGDLQLLTEDELVGIIGASRLSEANGFLSSFGGRLRKGEEPLHERARKVFGGTSTDYISVVHLYTVLGKERVHTLRLTGVRSAGVLSQLSREEIDQKCDGYEPLTDDEVRQLRVALGQLGLESNAY